MHFIIKESQTDQGFIEAPQMANKSIQSRIGVYFIGCFVLDKLDFGHEKIELPKSWKFSRRKTKSGSVQICFQTIYQFGHPSGSVVGSWCMHASQSDIIRCATEI